MSNLFSIGEALDSLGIKEWVLSNEPNNEVEFSQYFSKVVGVDENQSAVLSNSPADFGVTWAEIQAEIARLQADYTAKQYQRDRAAAYPSFADQFDLLYHGGYDTWKAAIDQIKQEYPKP